MPVYLYDGTFEGLLSTLSELWQQKTEPDGIFDGQAYTPQLFDQTHTIETDLRAVQRCVQAIKQRVSAKTIRKIFYVFLSNKADKDLKIYQYVSFALQKGARVEQFLSDDRVKDINDLYGQVSKEGHLMRGLVRFKELKDGLLYAQVAPDHLVLPLLAAYFSKRLSALHWMIHDVKRHKAVFHDRRGWRMRKVELDGAPLLTDDELFYQGLWQQYFKTIAIEERRNPRCQRQHMPQRYWKYLVEMEGDSVFSQSEKTKKSCDG